MVTTRPSALPDSHRPISSIRIAPSAFSALLTISGSNVFKSAITSWALSSSMLHLSTRHTHRKRGAATNALGGRGCSHRNHKIEDRVTVLRALTEHAVETGLANFLRPLNRRSR